MVLSRCVAVMVLYLPFSSGFFRNDAPARCGRIAARSLVPLTGNSRAAKSAISEAQIVPGGTDLTGPVSRFMLHAGPIPIPPIARNSIATLASFR